MEQPVTSESEWLEALQCASHWYPNMQRVVVVAPHPDDEVLGTGGMIAERCREKLPVLVVAVTDGEAAYPSAPDLGALRRVEQERALRAVGLSGGDIVRLGLPDGDVSAFEDSLVESLREILTADSVLVAPWELDSHPDHEACGRAAVRAAEACDSELVSYLFWAWHRRRPESLLPLAPRKFELDPELRTAKALALTEYRSQLKWEAGEPILPELLLAPARRSFETFIVHGDRHQHGDKY